MKKPRHSFESQVCTLTLAEGLAEYYEKNPALVRGDHLSAEAREFFRSHDTAHVVFGCGTSMPDEAVVKIASFFGTTEGFKVLRGYRLYESLDIYRRLPLLDTLRALAYAAYLVPRTIYRCAKQTRRWPWRDFEPDLAVPLHTLRMQFGIEVAHNDTGHSRADARGTEPRSGGGQEGSTGSAARGRPT